MVLSCKTSDMERSLMHSNPMPNKRAMASLANMTVFCADSTRTGTGRYCSAVREAMVADGAARCIFILSLCMELGEADLQRSPMAKYPPSPLPASAIMIAMLRWCECVVGPGW